MIKYLSLTFIICVLVSCSKEENKDGITTEIGERKDNIDADANAKIKADFEKASSNIKTLVKMLAKDNYQGKVTTFKEMAGEQFELLNCEGLVDSIEILNQGSDFKGNMTEFIRIKNQFNTRLFFQDGSSETFSD